MAIVEAAFPVSFKNILLATDFSPASEKALLYARAFARQHDARVSTLHVAGRNDYQLLCPEAFSITFNPLADNCTAGSGILRGLLRDLPREVPVHGSEVWEIIADVAVRNETDLLIVGTHGRTGMQKLMFGSVAEEVLREVPCPVLTVGSHAKEPDSNLKINRVLLATDCSPDSLAPAYAAFLCQQFAAELTVLTVSKEAPAGQFALRQRCKDHLARMTPEIMSLDPRSLFLVDVGDPAEKILENADEMDADLIVLGAHHPPNIRTVSHLPWATAGHVISRAECPVLTVRDRIPSALQERPIFASEVITGS